MKKEKVNEASEAVKRCQRRKKKKAVDYLGGKCSICKYNKCLGSLAFHHTDPNVKEYEVSYIVYRRVWDFVKKELDKCILVCANCHGEIHWGQIKLEDLKNQPRRLIKIKCCSCNKDFFTQDEDQVFCSVECVQYSQRKVERPTKEQLVEDMKTLSWVALGKKYGVSDNGARKWARSYKLI